MNDAISTDFDQPRDTFGLSLMYGGENGNEYGYLHCLQST